MRIHRLLFFTIFYFNFLFYQYIDCTNFPVRNDVQVSSVFGETRGDHFHNGIDFATPQPIYPFKKGVVIFIHEENSNPTLSDFGNGNFIVIEHENKLRSYYYHLKHDSVIKIKKKSNTNSFKNLNVENDTEIGFIGDSGHSKGAHLHFIVENLHNQTIINPLRVLPQIKDKSSPAISSMLLLNQKSKNKFISLRSFKTPAIKKKHYQQVVGIAYDQYNHQNYLKKRGLYKITFLKDKEVIREYLFDELKVSDKGLYISPHYYHDDIYGLAYNYKFGEFIPSKRKHLIEIITYDWNQNTAKKKYELQFRL